MGMNPFTWILQIIPFVILLSTIKISCCEASYWPENTLPLTTQILAKSALGWSWVNICFL